jgi:hypothetical protein
MPLNHDPTAPRKKYALLKFARDQWNPKHPNKIIERIEGFNPETEVIGEQAREFLRHMQAATGLPVTGKFDQATMLKLFPPNLRGRVMARAHAEVGETEWPPGSNWGPVKEYLLPLGITYGAPWCAAYVTWVLKKEGFMKFPPNPAYVPSWGEWATQKKIVKPHAQSKLGDLWCWNWDGGSLDHIGFCDEGIKGASAFYVDGNVGANGGTVTDAARPESGIALVIDLDRLRALK